MFKLYVENKVQKIIGDVYCPTCKNKKCVYISAKKPSFYDCKKSNSSCHVPKIQLKEQKSTLTSFGGDGTNCFAKKTNRNCEKRFPYLNFRGQS